MNTPLSPHPSNEEINRLINAAKQLRNAFFRQMASNAKHWFAAQSRRSRTVEASAAVMGFAAAIFWLALPSTPKLTEAGQPMTPHAEAATTTRSNLDAR
jgi:hypothetical protein